MAYLNFSETNHTEQCFPSDDVNYWYFFTCLQKILSKSPLKSSIAISFDFGIISMNILVIYYLYHYRKNKTVFDKIFIAHAFVDLLIGKIIFFEIVSFVIDTK